MSDEEIIEFVTQTGRNDEGSDDEEDSTEIVLERIVTAGDAILSARTSFAYLEGLAGEDDS